LDIAFVLKKFSVRPAVGPYKILKTVLPYGLVAERANNSIKLAASPANSHADI
jgi:hypothetical protein